MTSARQRPPLQGTVLLISRSAETLDGLQFYLSRIGIASTSRQRVNPLADVPEHVRVLVVFPDDFPMHEVTSYLAIVQARRPELKLLIISKEPAAYYATTALNGRRIQATVLPQPAFGWTILDAIRAATSGEQGALHP